ncbi:MAG: polymerase sporulation sigma factor SigF [Bacillota bacterium]|jgi:RNA polymerase sporulation-specific sigma factor
MSSAINSTRVTNNCKTKLTNEQVKEMIKAAQQGDNSTRSTLVNHNLRLVWSVVQRFLGRGHEAEDLFQVGCIGLLKAVDKFDLSFDVKFSTYAVPMILGEIQRFLRDDGLVKVSRSLKEQSSKIRSAIETLTKTKNRTPTIHEVAVYLGVDDEEVVLAQEANRMPGSIDETVYEHEGDPITLLDQLADDINKDWFDKFTIQEILKKLTARQRLIVYLRYFKDHTQSEVANRLGVSQVQISRLEKKILKLVKVELN